MNRIEIILISFLLLAIVPNLHAQNKLDSLMDFIMQNDGLSSVKRLQEFEENELPYVNDTIKCDYIYVQAAFFEHINVLDIATKYYREYTLKADSMHYYAPQFFHSSLCVMLWDNNNNNTEEAISIGFSAIRAPWEKQLAYPYQYMIYINLAPMLLMTSRYADVPEITKQGWYYVNQQIEPTDTNYYQLPFTEALAWCMLGDSVKADSCCNWIEKNDITHSESLHKSLTRLREITNYCRDNGLMERKIATNQDIEDYKKELLLTDASTEKGRNLFCEYFSFIRNSLIHYYYDVDNVNDEKVWSTWLFDMMSYFYLCCDSMEGREGEAYDNVLTRKDFMCFHVWKSGKRPMSWTDIQNRLEEHEAAIEICSLPEEVLILRKDFKQPHSIRIDSLLFEQIVAGLQDEPLAIDTLYSLSGPLSTLWKLISPEIQGIRTLYISGSNVFSQINYGAIPLDKGEVVSDKYELHTLLSTSDAGLTREFNHGFKDAVVFGGINYEDAEYTSAKNQYDDEPWQLTRGLPEDIRSGFHNLPGSQKEVDGLDSIMISKKVEHHLSEGRGATEESFKSLDGKAPDLLHISTHGFMLAPLFNSNQIAKVSNSDTTRTKYKTILSQSGLLFAGANKAWRDFEHGDHNDGILTSREITQLDLSGCKLAVLSACRSALGETRNLTGVPFGVAYALKLAGVKQVLCSLWSIKDDATATFMKKFYEYLFNVNNAREALRMTQQDMMRSREYSSPYYWASFVIVE